MSLTVFAALAMSASAQDTYTNVQFANEDLNGTARYVGMGGALEALGADISTISSNPAGIGMMRRSVVSGTAGVQIGNSNTIESNDAHQGTFGFDQLGFVWVSSSDASSFVNVGFNYHKSKNFNQLFDVTNSLNNNASQHKATYDKFADGDMNVGWKSESVLDDLYNRGFMFGQDEKGAYQDYYEYRNASRFRNQQKTSGYISDFDFNISGNINNTLFLGATFSLRDVHYLNNSLYTEQLLDLDDVSKLAVMDVEDETRITGTGYSIKLGAIYRPILTSSFRIGAYIHTPTFYDLKKTITTYVDMEYVDGDTYSIGNGDDPSYLEFALHTPWKFGASMGYTVGSNLALGATYEYSKYSAMDNRIKNAYGSYNDYITTTSDDVMNANTEKSLKGVHTLKVGAEYRPVSQLAIRVGYNYLSAMYNENGMRDASLQSQGVWASSTTDYTNWNSTQRITCGLGYTIGDFNIDLAYQYRTTSGNFYPFRPYDYSGTEYAADSCIPSVSKIKDNRHKLSLTVGYRF